MKTMKKLAGFALALVLLVSLCVPALAADEPTYSITVENDKSSVTIDGVVFSAYKIFSATYNEATGSIAYSFDDTCLSVSYNGKQGKELLSWLAGAEDADVRSFADYVYDTYINLTPAPDAAGTGEADGERAIIKLTSPGYYLVYGTGAAQDGGSTVTAAVSLTTAAPTDTVKPKFDAPTLSKEIFHDDQHEWDTVGDFAIGDVVNFRITSSVPNTYGYDKYTYVIHDTMAESLTLKTEGDVMAKSDFIVEVTKNGQTAALGAQYYELKIPTDTCSFELSIDIMGAGLAAGDSITVTYQAILNEKAIIHDDGKQANTAWLEFSNNPYNTGTPGDDDTPDEPGDTGKTTPDTVYAWTYHMGVNKVDNSTPAKPLTGAQFVLSTKDDLDISDLGSVTNLVPSKTENLIGLVATDTGYRIAKADETAIYVMDAGSIYIDGLNDAVDYYLYEIKAPAGYNMKEEPVHFKITADYKDEGQSKADGFPKVLVDDAEEASTTLSTDIVNQTGTVLPTTGGVGTTIFYILGGVLVAAAVVLLITRKRMNMEN